MATPETEKLSQTLTHERFRSAWLMRLLTVVLGLYWTAIFTVTHLPPPALPKTGVSDKVSHFVAYFGLTLLLGTWRVLRRPAESRVRNLAVTVGIVAFYGVADELLQIPVDRHADVMDWCADMLGCVAAIVVVAIGSVFLPRNKVSENRSTG